MSPCFYSRKAKGVTETEVYLGRQSEGYERFEPSYLSKVIVRNFLQVHNALMTVLPKKAVRFLDSRYKRVESVETSPGEDGVMYFDTLRASVNLVVASILISIGTYMRVPLSTTFVVFMVAMGSSLADQALGTRECCLQGFGSIVYYWRVVLYRMPRFYWSLCICLYNMVWQLAGDYCSYSFGYIYIVSYKAIL